MAPPPPRREPSLPSPPLAYAPAYSPPLGELRAGDVKGVGDARHVAVRTGRLGRARALAAFFHCFCYPLGLKGPPGIPRDLLGPQGNVMRGGNLLDTVVAKFIKI